MFLEGTVIIISLVVSIRSTLLQVMTQIPVQNDIIIIIPIYNFRVDIQDMEEKRKKQKHKFNQRQTQKVRALLMSAIERERAGTTGSIELPCASIWQRQHRALLMQMGKVCVCVEIFCNNKQFCFVCFAKVRVLRERRIMK